MTEFDDDVAFAVVRAIATTEGVEPHRLDYALHEYVATDAIRSLACSDCETWQLTFEVPGHLVAVDGTGEIRVDGEPVVETALDRSEVR